MRAAGPNHSNILLVMVICCVLGICLYALTYWVGGWRALIGVAITCAIVWAILLIDARWRP